MAQSDVPLVLIHGLLDDGGMWEHQVRHLSAYAPVVTPDILEPETVGDAADLVLASVEGPFAVAGFSMGGYILFEMLRRAPERLTRLALLNTSARPNTPEKIADRERAIALARSGRYEALVAEALPNVVHPSRHGDPLMAELETMALRVGAEAYCRQQRVCMSRPDSRALLPEIDRPTLVITGRQDTLVPPALSEEMADAIPGARLVTIDDCNHYASMERPWAVTALLQDWLRHP